ncbi:hypothetical protein EXIGLDRAFT_755162 [Exidia glandulosa HHB12029]|uniref:Uncharacterized protein n=1 Tax=Exidia glandulosa HHB12029 TaxID=1314781 RepID=A0A165CAC1_EXIGL|nr:hypothetical protein EXIGLDRAFT_755162 [Exidia glandulosa HHB12029]
MAVAGARATSAPSVFTMSTLSPIHNATTHSPPSASTTPPAYGPHKLSPIDEESPRRHSLKRCSKSVKNMRAHRKEAMDKLARGLSVAFTPKSRRSSLDDTSAPPSPSTPLTPTSPKTKRPRLCPSRSKRCSTSSEDSVKTDSALGASSQSTLVTPERKASEDTLVEEPESDLAEVLVATLPELPSQQQQLTTQENKEISNQTLAVVAFVLAISQMSICVLSHIKATGL